MTNDFHAVSTVCVGFERRAHLPVEEKITIFFDMFHVPFKERDLYHPLFLLNTYSRSGELAPSFGLFLRDGHLYEVHGSECSVWDFNGQWELEATSVSALRHRMERGDFGSDDDHPFKDELSQLLDQLELHNVLADPKARAPSSAARKI